LNRQSRIVNLTIHDSPFRQELNRTLNAQVSDTTGA